MKYVYAVLALNIFFILLFFIFGSYPWIIIFFHLASLIFFLLYAINLKFLSKFLLNNKIEIIFVFILFVLAFVIRIYKIDVVTPGLQGDELNVAKSALVLIKGPFVPFIFDTFGHGTMMPYLVGMSLSIFGKSIFAIRLPSVIFGALGVVALYILLRFFFKKTTSFFGSLLFVFSYTQISLSRLAFESTESIFFQIVTGIFLYLSLKFGKLRYFLGLGLALALGNYTYLDFRVFTIIVFSILLGFCLSQKKKFLQKIFPFVFVSLTFLASAGPLVHYSFVNTGQMTSRANHMSIFNQGLTSSQIAGNLFANIKKIIYVFVSPGDPNGRVNPGNTSMFDFITTGIFIVGGVFLFRKHRKLFYILLFMFLVPIISDIFAKESGPATGGPNDFNGFGHPNFMRIEGFIPLVYFTASFGLEALQKILKKYKYALIIPIVIICAFLNYNSYFNQPFNGYTYSVNGVNDLFVANVINHNFTGKKIYLSPNLKNSLFLQFFINDKNKLYLFNPQSLDSAISIIKSSDVTIIDAYFNQSLIESLYQNQTNGLTNFSFQPVLIYGRYIGDIVYIKTN